MFGAQVDYPTFVGSVFGALALVAVQWLRGRQGKVERTQVEQQRTQVDQQTLLDHYEGALRDHLARIDRLEAELQDARDQIRVLRNGHGHI